MRVIHGFVLALINLASILVGFAVFTLSGSGHQVAVQVPVALLGTVAGFAAWLWLVRRSRLGWDRTRLRQRAAVFVLAFLGAAVVFIPLHFFTQGYVTAWSNVTALWAFQAPANLLAMLVAERRFASGPERKEHA
ncbi:MAG: hypothetical protein OEX18_14065 [Candidatus Krumholzibacteria bacterium]|nr:hypothetical protein [Candidatus Krumholzibacteria bacterium]MDH5271340.1 hypothetical protein [Candidatus Krumholzibacteria bacterium]